MNQVGLDLYQRGKKKTLEPFDADDDDALIPPVVLDIARLPGCFLAENVSIVGHINIL